MQVGMPQYMPSTASDTEYSQQFSPPQKQKVPNFVMQPDMQGRIYAMSCEEVALTNEITRLRNEHYELEKMVGSLHSSRAQLRELFHLSKSYSFCVFKYVFSMFPVFISVFCKMYDFNYC